MDYLDSNPLMDDALIMRLTFDLAAAIHPPETIATRYGFPDVPEMREYLKRHPQIILNASKMKATMESDEGSEARIRLRAMQATEDLIPSCSAIAADPRIAPQQRIDAFKQLSRVSGLDASAAAKAAAGAGGPAFTLNILFRNNPQENLTVMPETPVPVTPGVIDDIDEALEEDV